MKTFEKLAQKNVDHYNDHTAAHLALIAGAGVVAVGAFGFMGKKIREIQERPRKIPG